MICVNDRVLVHYAVLTDDVGFHEGHGLFFVGGKEIGPVPCLAICQDRESSAFTLYYCDSGWSSIGIAAYESVEALVNGGEVDTYAQSTRNGSRLILRARHYCSLFFR